MKIERYRDCYKPDWDRFVAGSKNGTFLFLRDYMDYHRERFPDHSLLVLDDHGSLAAVLPATAMADGSVSSHAGLSYGGFVTDDSMKIPRLLRSFDATLTYLREAGWRRLVYKSIPHIYHQTPAEEDRYALMRCGARWIRSGLLAVATADHRLSFQERRRRGISRARRAGLEVRPSNELHAFWEVLSALLKETYGTQPVHTATEMESLMERFPKEIRLFVCYRGRELLAGVLVYESVRVAHAQYIAATEWGKRMGALDLTFQYLLDTFYSSKPYFDFGTSERDGCINEGLIEQKEGFGARAVAQDQYVIELESWVPGSLKGALV